MRHGCKRFVFASSAAVYGKPARLPLSEDSPGAPMSPYGAAKLAAEKVLEGYARSYGLSTVALRYFNVAGADPQGRTGQSTRGATHLIKVACETALGKRPFMEIFGEDYPTPDGTCVRDYIHVTDLVTAHRLALHRLREGGSSLVANCGYGTGYSVREIVQGVERVFGSRIDVRHGPRRPGDAISVVANPARAVAELGWKPALDDMDTIINTALNWEEALIRKNAANS